MSQPWPSVVQEALSFLAAEVTTITANGTPVTWPLTPYPSADGRTIDFSTGVTYPAKAERARRNPKVSALFSDPDGSGAHRPPVVLVQGLATVRDADVQSNTDRYIAESLKKLPGAWKGQPDFMIRAQSWYWARVYVCVTPVAVRWWPEGDVSRPPETWTAPSGLVAPPSDPAPQGPPTPPWQRAPEAWQARADYALEHLGNPVVSVVGPEGYPVSTPALSVRRAADGFSVQVPQWFAASSPRSACITFSVLEGEGFKGQQNASLVGELDGGGLLKVERLLPDFSLPSKGLARYKSFLGARRRLRSRLESECRRRGQEVPQIRIQTSRQG